MNELHIAENNPQRLEEVKAETSPVTAVADYQDLLRNDDIDAIMISTAPKTMHFPMAKDSLNAGKHVFLEKPLSLPLEEADELVALAARTGVKISIGYSLRLNPKFAYVRK